ncbi:hypothetical protein DH2020_033361 [Rehmannia glutinosa]|uniref:RING-type domain-containing protein n=1 Tax=Rehmannia glutinosa TaxID=99300 RepID=A0ABR0VFH1_REHGL
MKRWFWFSTGLSWVCRELSSSQSGLVLIRLVKKFALALLICVFALGGATIGAITGAIKGQTTETGFTRGFGVGAVAGAITGVQLMELISNGEPFSKSDRRENIYGMGESAMLKAYQWQVSTTETSLRETSDIFEVNTIRGLSQDTIKELPVYKFYNAETTTSSSCSETSCAICLQDLKDGEYVRLLSNCKHFYHLQCIDEWLIRQGAAQYAEKMSDGNKKMEKLKKYITVLRKYEERRKMVKI